MALTKVVTDIIGSDTLSGISGSFRGELSSSVYLRQVSSTISGSLGANASVIRALDRTTISGSIPQALATNSSPTFAAGTITGDLSVGGTLTAQEVHTEFESASILFTSGSTRFGDDTTDTHRVTGSMDVSGSLDIPHGNLSVIDKVGVGTNNPTVALEVFGSSDQQIRIDSTGNRAQLQFDGKKTSDAEFAEINFANDGDSAAAIHAMRDGANDAARLAFFTQPTGGSVTERMSIDSGGNVGIGTTNPTKLLDLESSGTEASVDFTNDTKTYRIGISDFSAGDDRLFFTDATKDITRMSITSEGSTLLSGSLQIESDLDTPLTIKKTSNGEMFIRFMNASGAMKGALIYRTDSNQFSLRTDNTTAFSIDSSQLVSFNGDIELNGSGTRQIRFDDGSESEGAIVFDEITDGFIFKVGGTSSVGKTDAFKIQNSGNITVGRNDATSISAAEIAADDDSVLGLIIKNANTGNGSGGMLKFSNNNGNALTALGSIQDGSNSASMLFFTESGGTFAERMRVDHSGAVGIGTNAPANLLHVYQDASSYPVLFQQNQGDGFVLDLLASASDDAANDPLFRARTDAATLLELMNDGRLLVNVGHFICAGAVIPGATSEVDNQKIFDSSSGSGSNTLFIGNAQIQVSSDKRLKINIRDTEMNPIETLNRLRVVDFDWDDPKDTSWNNKMARVKNGGQWSGILAQEAVEVVPHIINAPRIEETLELDHESKNTWQVEYEHLVPTLVKAVQELSKKVEDLESQISNSN